MTRPDVGMASPARIVVSALGTTALLAVAEPDALAAAEHVLRDELAAIDAACSRFRPDSEISRLPAGSAAAVGPLLAEAITVALRAAEQTDGIVDPTVGAAVQALGYDRDFAGIDPDRPDPLPRPEAAPGWWRIGWDGREVVVPRGVELDLGATAKALSADRIATRAAEATGAGVLVSLGGDVRVAGPAPEDGWRIAVGDDHERALVDPELVISITAGGLATSSTTRRAWRRAGAHRAPHRRPAHRRHPRQPVAHGVRRRRHLRRRQHGQHRRHRARHHRAGLARRAPPPRPSRRRRWRRHHHPGLARPPREECRLMEELLWFVSRACGLVSLLLLTATVVLGCAHATRASAGGWLRFTLHALHRNVSLLAVVFLAVHIASAIFDGVRRTCSGSTPSCRSSRATTRSGWAWARSRSTCSSR